MIHPVAIVGAGPAGIAAALQLQRAGISPLLLEKERAGGLLWNAQQVENYPGFPRGISGRALAQKFCRQLRRAGLALTREKVLALHYTRGVFRIQTQRQLHRAAVVVLAPGTKPRGGLACPIPPAAAARVCCELYPLRKMRGKRLAIAGAGDTAFDYALSLARRNRVTILNRGWQRRCLPLLWQRSRAGNAIEYLPDHRLAAIRYSAGALALHFARPGRHPARVFDYLLLATGRRPQLDFLTAGLRRRQRQLRRQGRLFIIGDAGQGIYRQVAIAAGDGLKAAMKIIRRQSGTKQ